MIPARHVDDLVTTLAVPWLRSGTHGPRDTAREIVCVTSTSASLMQDSDIAMRSSQLRSDRIKIPSHIHHVHVHANLLCTLHRCTVSSSSHRHVFVSLSVYNPVCPIFSHRCGIPFPHAASPNDPRSRHQRTCRMRRSRSCASHLSQPGSRNISNSSRKPQAACRKRRDGDTGKHAPSHVVQGCIYKQESMSIRVVEPNGPTRREQC